MSPKISCAMIIRDEASTLEACLQSVRPYVDEIVCVDTGSTDGSMDIARKYADKVELYLGCNDDQGRIVDFSDARNKSFELATHDHIIWLDGDDVLVGGENLRAMAEAVKNDLHAYVVPYDYAHAANGAVTLVHHRERFLFPRHRFIWQCPVHEGCLPKMPIEGGELISEPTDAIKVIHRQEHSTKPREKDRNLRILKRYIEQVGEGDPRAMYYLGREYWLSGDMGNSLYYLKRYIEISDWSDERCLAMLLIAREYQHVGDHASAIDWALRASITKVWPAPYFTLGRSFYAMAESMKVQREYNYRRAAAFIEMGLKLVPTSNANQSVLDNHPLEKFEIHRFLNIALSRIGNIQGALESCEQGLSGLPDDPELLENRLVYRKYLEGERIKQWETDGIIGEPERIIMQATLKGEFGIEIMPEPGPMPSDGEAKQTVFNSYERQRAPGKLDLVFYVGHQLEPWNSRTLEKNGMGGSETMCAELSKRLAELGHRVRVYGHCTPTMEGLIDGVEWLDATKYRNVECDVLIASRQPAAVDDGHGLKAGARVLWVHDVHVGEALNQSRDLRFDRIFALSNWHKAFLLRCYPKMDPSKIIVTRNGIDLSRFEGTEWRNPHRVVYSSSPDRGLLTLLECWPEIRKAVPDAELHCFYGFGNWQKSLDFMPPDMRTHEANEMRKIEHLAKNTAGVVYRGRVNQKELAREFMRSGVWAYPTWFSETSCITAMEAQAAGLRIVTSAIAALNETVGDRGVLLDWGDPLRADGRTPLREYREKFIREVVRMMQLRTEDMRELPESAWSREKLQQYARDHFGLDTLAADWDAMLSDIHRDVTTRVVPKFHHVELQP